MIASPYSPILTRLALGDASRVGLKYEYGSDASGPGELSEQKLNYYRSDQLKPIIRRELRCRPRKLSSLLRPDRHSNNRAAFCRLARVSPAATLTQADHETSGTALFCQRSSDGETDVSRLDFSIGLADDESNGPNDTSRRRQASDTRPG